jgi:DNA polymerase/3'-5' exonuclease PolX
VLEKYNNTQNLIDTLKTWKYHIDTLAYGNKKISFIIKSPISNLIRQIDIILVPKKYYYASLIYFTGNKEFNERIRGLAKKRGLRLNEYYLQNTNTKEIKLLRSEREIFDILGIKYLKPEERF